MEVLLTVVGSVLAVIGSINAFFLKGLMDSINGIKLDLLETSTEHRTTIRDVTEAKTRIRMNEEEISRARERLHKLEGGQSQLLSYLKEFDVRK